MSNHSVRSLFELAATHTATKSRPINFSLRIPGWHKLVQAILIHQQATILQVARLCAKIIVSYACNRIDGVAAASHCAVARMWLDGVGISGDAFLPKMTGFSPATMATTGFGANTCYLALLLDQSGMILTLILRCGSHTASVGTRVLEVTRQLSFAKESKQPSRVISR